MNKQTSNKKIIAEVPYWFIRIAALLSLVMIFFPSMNAARVSAKISKNLSVFTTAVSWDSLVNDVKFYLRVEQLPANAFHGLQTGSIVLLIGIALAGVAACMSLGNNKMRKLGLPIGIAGSAVEIVGLLLVYSLGYQGLLNATVNTDLFDTVAPSIPLGFWMYGIMAIVYLLASFAMLFLLPKTTEEKFEMKSQYKLFLILLPFLILVFIFSYLPLYGWRYAFFDYSIGDDLDFNKFVGLKWFKTLIADQATRANVIKVLRNTLVMSGLGILTSWLPMAFAIFLTEIKTGWFKRIVQVFTTIPNFVSWVLVYSLALALFNTDGLVNNILGTHTNFLLEGPEYTWLKMWLWGTWKGIGWSAIIYIAGISGISKELYEAATVDGAGRFQKMWHVTVPGLIPTFFVLLLMGIGNILSNGMDQYLVFSNNKNMDFINVLDLYVYNLGLGDADFVPLSTVISMTKSLISVVLLFLANGVSKLIRGESIM